MFAKDNHAQGNSEDKAGVAEWRDGGDITDARGGSEEGVGQNAHQRGGEDSGNGRQVGQSGPARDREK